MTPKAGGLVICGGWVGGSGNIHRVYNVYNRLGFILAVI